MRRAILCIGVVVLPQPRVVQDVMPENALAAHKIISRHLPSFWEAAADEVKVLVWTERRLH